MASVLAIFLFTCVASGSDYAENEIFDAVHTTPQALLLTQYAKTRLLALGESNHSHFKIHAELLALLDRIGTDTDLRYIVLERYHDNAPFFEDLSVNDLESVMKKAYFRDWAQMDAAICEAFPATPYMISEFFPRVREINRHRPANKPLLVTSIDGTTFPAAPHPASGSLRAGNCTYAFPWADYAMSSDREHDTASNFESHVWNNLKPNEKAILLYHHAHLRKGGEFCFPHVAPNQNTWETSWSRPTWFGMFLDRHPEATAQSRIVIFDEIDPQYAPNGYFRFSSRQSARNPGSAWAVELAPFVGALPETGIQVFMPDSRSAKLSGAPGMFRGNEALPDTADAIIWSPDAERDFKLKDGKAYLPNICVH